MKWNKLFLLTTLWMIALVAVAQRTEVTGVVVNAQTGDRLPQVSVCVADGGSGQREAVVTNDDGQFTLKSDQVIRAITVSHVGYSTQRITLNESSNDTASRQRQLTVRLQPAAIQLRDITVWTGNPRELVSLAISKIPDNYSHESELSGCFYRETAMKRQHYVYVAEGVVDMYKTPYSHSTNRDRVAIRKGRRLMSPRRGDTLTVKVTGGPVQPVSLDIVKNLDLLLNDEELRHYDFQMLTPQNIGDRLQYVVAIAPSPYSLSDFALYHGRLYIDQQTLAFSRVELELDMTDRDKATRMMLVRKPLGLRFKPRELSLVVDYDYDGAVSRMSYVRTRFRFNCDWKRRLLATSFTATCELVVTERQGSPARQPIAGRESFDSRDAFYDKVDYFRDPDFWRDYNIIEPTESLEKAVGKLLKRI